MHPKTFKAPTAKKVLSQISRELGPDAIIVSHRKIKDSEGQLWVEATASPRAGSASDMAAFPTPSTSVLKKKIPLTIGGLTAMFALIVAAAIIFWPKGEAIPTLEEKRIVVLPFENLGPAEDNYFADGITDEITTRLARIDGLGVIARTSAYQYKAKDKALKKIGDELRVDYALEGTIRWQRSPDGPGQVRITPQLIRVSDATHVWAHVYDEDITDIFKVQSSIAEQVAEALDITLLESERQALKARPTDNLEAYNYYLRGKDYLNIGIKREEIKTAIQMFEKAVELDSTFALAYALLSYSHSSMYGNRWDQTEERLAKAKQALDKAIELRPDMPEAHLAMGGYYRVQHDWGRALKHYNIAQKSMQDDSELLKFISDIQWQKGKFEQALATAKRAFELDPRSAVLAYWVALHLRTQRRFPEAEKYFDLAISLAPENSFYYNEKAELYLLWEGSTEKARKVFKDIPKFASSSGKPSLGMAYKLDMYDGKYQEALDRLSSLSRKALRGRMSFYPIALIRAQIYGHMNQPELAKSHYESACRILEILIREQPEDARYHGSLGIAYAGLGRKEEAIREGKLAVELEKDVFVWFEIFRVDELAQIYAMVGEHDQAVDQLEYLLSYPHEHSIPLLRIDPKWNPLREHPRFQKLLEGGK